MSLFQGEYPYGTPGGTDDPLIATDPPVIRIASGRSVVLFLRVNGPISSKIRTQIEDIVRILDPSGTIIPPVGGVTLTVTDNTVLIDENVQQIDFGSAIQVVGLPSNQVLIKIPNGAISALLTSGNIASTLKLINEAVTSGKLAPLSVDTLAIAPGAVTPTELDRVYMELADVPPANPAIIHGSVVRDSDDIVGPLGTGTITLPTGAITIPNNGITYDVICKVSYSMARTTNTDSNFAHGVGVYNVGTGIAIQGAYNQLFASVGAYFEQFWIHVANTWVTMYQVVTVLNQTNKTIAPILYFDDWASASSVFLGNVNATITAYPRVEV